MKTSVKQEYASKINSGEWRGFTRRIRASNGQACQICKRGNVTLQVHHWFYEQGREPWEYKPDEVILLCITCHHELHKELQNFRKYVFQKMTPQVLRIINGALAVAMDQYEGIVFAHALAEVVGSPKLISQYAAQWNISSVKRSDEEKAFDKFQASIGRRKAYVPPGKLT